MSMKKIRLVVGIGLCVGTCTPVVLAQQPTLQGLAQTKPGTALLLIARPGGINPSQVNVRPGPVSFTVISKTGHSQTDFRIVPVGGTAALAAARIDLKGRGQIKATATANLPPGEYRLLIDGRPNVSCQITVAP